MSRSAGKIHFTFFSIFKPLSILLTIRRALCKDEVDLLVKKDDIFGRCDGVLSI